MSKIIRSFCILGVLSLSASVFATPLNLTQGFPDFASLTSISTNYNAQSESFTVTGFVNQYSDAGATSHLASGTFTLSALIDNSGAFGSGTLTINGIVLDGISPPPASDLLIVDLTHFGFSGTGASTVFEFAGDTVGGTMAAQFDPRAGVILNPGTTSYAGSFANDFFGSDGTVDTFLIPEPTSVMLTLGCMSFVAARRRKRRGDLT